MEKMRLLIIGGNGQLGSDFNRYAPLLKYEVCNLTHEDVEITNRDSVFNTLNTLNFDVIINTATYHGQKAYEDKTPDNSYAVNMFGPFYLAQYAQEHGKKFVHFSTDYVYSGNVDCPEGGFSEEDLPIPGNIYGTSKLAGEHLVGITCEQSLIIRVASLYGYNGCRAKNNSNFVEMMMAKMRNHENIKVVDDIFMSPTSTKSIVQWTVKLLENNQTGLYHLAGSGGCSWYDLTIAIAKFLNYPENLIERSSTRHIQQEVKRGNNTALHNKKLQKTLGSNLPHWQECLHEYLTERDKYIT